MNYKAAILTIFILFLTITGCGRKGPLYLPDEEATKTTSQETQNISK